MAKTTTKKKITGAAGKVKKPAETPVAKTRYEGELTANSKRNRPAFYYKLSEKDHPVIIQGLSHFVSVYQIAAKIGCGYTTLKLYINKHPELLAVQEDSQKGELEFVKGKFMQKIAAGSLGAMCFYLERKGGWTNRQQVDTNAPLPNIVLGVIPEDQLPTDGIGEPEKLAPVAKLAKREDDMTIERTEAETEAETIKPEVVEQEDREADDEPDESGADDFDEAWGDAGDAGGLF